MHCHEPHGCTSPKTCGNLRRCRFGPPPDLRQPFEQHLRQTTAESLDQLATDLSWYVEQSELTDGERESLNETITYLRGRAALYRARATGSRVQQ